MTMKWRYWCKGFSDVGVKSTALNSQMIHMLLNDEGEVNSVCVCILIR